MQDIGENARAKETEPITEYGLPNGDHDRKPPHVDFKYHAKKKADYQTRKATGNSVRVIRAKKTQLPR